MSLICFPTCYQGCLVSSLASLWSPPPQNVVFSSRPCCFLLQSGKVSLPELFQTPGQNYLPKSDNQMQKSSFLAYLGHLIDKLHLNFSKRYLSQLCARGESKCGYSLKLASKQYDPGWTRNVQRLTTRGHGMENSAWDYDVFVCGRQKVLGTTNLCIQSRIQLLSKPVFSYPL